MVDEHLRAELHQAPPRTTRTRRLIWHPQKHPVRHQRATCLGISFMPSPDDKIVKNRLHLDLNPGPDTSGDERQAEIERLISLGARPIDVGQRDDEPWAVLADPGATSSALFAPRER